ncbi:glycosyl hydrolase 108 family protein [uncultured Cohaesibacter sp.]|uniref:glycoside hydrolase family 108 protein n=1 Tax=uncultured Cohaesibacter sp. TaxID=1002546 RepID=UPI00292F099C|nr:glycosyl hydrolase 108 family protein [uncultured Cohaesibacter sp.]
MYDTFLQIKPLLFEHEGGYTNNFKDPGNWTGGKIGIGRLVGTNHGVSAPTLKAIRHREITRDEMMELSRDQAEFILKRKYWDAVKADNLPAGIDYCVADYSVNSGTRRAAKTLQKVVGAKADGTVGPKTLEAIQSCGKSAFQIIDEICDQRLAFMQGLRAWKDFGRGWSSRVHDVREHSKRFASPIPQTKSELK